MKTSQKLSLLTVAALLAACGGGGDDSTNPVTNGGVTVPAPTGTSVPLQTSVPVPTYAPGSDLANAFAYLNAERLKCGFGALAQNASLDKSATAHAQYMVANPTSDPHTETKGLPGFTGVDGTARAAAAGYTSPGPEVWNLGSGYNAMFNLQYSAATTYIDNMAQEGTRKLLSAPYHAMGMLANTVDVGFGFHKVDTTVAGIRTIDAWLFVDAGYGSSSLGQMPASGTGVRTYPCEGVSNAKPALYSEWTASAAGLTPGRVLNLNPVGHPIMVFGEQGKTLELVSVRITDALTGEENPIYSLRVKRNDPNGSLYYRNDWTGYALPDKPFTPGRKYNVVINGTSGGVQFSKSFVFGVGQPDAHGY